MRIQIGLYKTAVLLMVLLLIIACGPPNFPQDETESVATTEPPAQTDETPPVDTPDVTPATDTATPESDTVTPEPTPIPLPTLSSLAFITIERIDADNGWGLTANKAAFTVDGGVTWYDVSISGVSDYSRASATFLDANQGWVLVPAADGMSGTLYRTTDRGSTWTSSAFPYFPTTLQFLDTLNGYAMVGLGAGAGSMAVMVIRTSDGGATWTEVFHNDPTLTGTNNSLPLGGMKNGITYRDASNAWITGSKPMDGFVYLYRSTDGGVNWMQQSLTLPAGMDTAMVILHSPVFFGTANGLLYSWLMTPADNMAYVYRTADGGNSWTAGTAFPPARSIASSDASSIWAWYETGLYHSIDGGASWILLSPGLPGGSDSVILDFVSGGYGWALLRDGDNATPDVLMGTSDGGQNWTTLAP